jgi:hypothetical protein
MTRETVETDTPLSFATSRMLLISPLLPKTFPGEDTA